jgi:hypothetical protein
MHPLAITDEGAIMVRPNEVIAREGFYPAQITAAESSAA